MLLKRCRLLMNIYLDSYDNFNSNQTITSFCNFTNAVATEKPLDKNGKVSTHICVCLCAVSISSSLKMLRFDLSTISIVFRSVNVLHKWHHSMLPYIRVHLAYEIHQQNCRLLFAAGHSIASPFRFRLFEI